jgi:hypothetical protein
VLSIPDPEQAPFVALQDDDLHGGVNMKERSDIQNPEGLTEGNLVHLNRLGALNTGS